MGTFEVVDGATVLKFGVIVLGVNQLLSKCVCSFEINLDALIFAHLFEFFTDAFGIWHNQCNVSFGVGVVVCIVLSVVDLMVVVAVCEPVF